MKKKTALLLILILTTSSAIAILPVKAQPRTIFVPDDYKTIADAIGNATNGDTIFVRQGTYEEHTLTINKTISLLGEDKENTTIINIDEPPAWDLVNPFPQLNQMQ